MPIPIPAPMAPMATPIHTTSELETPICAVARGGAVTASAQTTAVASIEFRLAAIATPPGQFKRLGPEPCWTALETCNGGIPACRCEEPVRESRHCLLRKDERIGASPILTRLPYEIAT